MRQKHSAAATNISGADGGWFPVGRELYGGPRAAVSI